ncbi:MAG: TetR family transcriptional regulator C-terminal domain-containing protein, partial [Erysipelotrichaceae bacterium]|nr:TetR family transcriptional regulator C-terminal domain-containing protein [Erysipelotrichaceae bacterium]
ICDKTGVIRGTFYNHFMDKYDALEYLTQRMIFNDFDMNQFDARIESSGKFAMHTLEVIYDKQEFFRRAFTITGQNSFENMLENIFTKSYISIFEHFDVDFSKTPVTKEYLARYLASTSIFICRDWVKTNYKQTPEEIFEIFRFLCSYSLTDFVYENAKSDN